MTGSRISPGGGSQNPAGSSISTHTVRRRSMSILVFRTYLAICHSALVKNIKYSQEHTHEIVSTRSINGVQG
jgi:hypothetical protein